MMMMMMMCLYCLSDKNTYYLMLGSAHVDEKVGRAFPHSFIASWRTLRNRSANYVDILLTKRILGPYLGKLRTKKANSVANSDTGKLYWPPQTWLEESTPIAHCPNSRNERTSKLIFYPKLRSKQTLNLAVLVQCE